MAADMCILSVVCKWRSYSGGRVSMRGECGRRTIGIDRYVASSSSSTHDHYYRLCRCFAQSVTEKLIAQRIDRYWIATKRRRRSAETCKLDGITRYSPSAALLWFFFLCLSFILISGQPKNKDRLNLHFFGIFSMSVQGRSNRSIDRRRTTSRDRCLRLGDCALRNFRSTIIVAIIIL